MNQKSFEDLTTARKGTIGEELVDSWLLSRHIIPYSPIVGVSHPFDRLCGTSDKSEIFIVECKTKSRRTYYPDTGIDIRHYVGYKRVSEKYGIRVRLFFIDEFLKRIYGNFLDELEKRVVVANIVYPLKQGGIIYFPLDAMEDICEITEESAKELKRLSTRNYPYLYFKEPK